jgi:PilZ domain.
MRKFGYRAPRFHVDFHIRLSQGGATQVAVCKEISTLGMKLEFERPLIANSLAVAHLSIEEMKVSIPCQITSSDMDAGGLRFIYESEQQKSIINEMVALLTAPKPCTSLTIADCFDEAEYISKPETY